MPCFRFVYLNYERTQRADRKNIGAAGQTENKELCFKRVFDVFNPVCIDNAIIRICDILLFICILLR